MEFWQSQQRADVLTKRNSTELTFPARWGRPSTTTFRPVIPTSHKAKIRKTGKSQAFLMPRRAWVRKSPDSIKIKKPGPTYSPAGEGSTLGRRRLHGSVRDGKRWFTPSLGTLWCFEGAYARLKAIFNSGGDIGTLFFYTPVDLPYRPHKGEVEDGVSRRSGMAITLTFLLQFSQEGISFFCQQFCSLPQEVFVSPHIPFFFESLLTVSSTGKRIGNQVTTQILL